MTRVKETQIGSDEIPDYKSPPTRIVRSLRKGYNNLRVRISKKSEEKQALRGTIRDVSKSRDQWKTRTKAVEERLKNANSKIKSLELELEEYKKKAQTNLG
jgi:chromosome segregation ATPase